MRLFSFLKRKPIKDNGIKFGWKRDLPDPRDFKFKITAPISLPDSVDLRPQCPPVYNQYNIGSCTANSMGGLFEFRQMKQGLSSFMPSRLYIYFNTRDYEGTANSDAGATLRDTMKMMVKYGACPESMWSYNKCFKKKPTPDCYVEGEKHQVIEYLRVTHTLYEIKQCLAQGNPVAFGIMLFESFMTDEVARTGQAIMPLSTESSIGGHAVLAVGYDEKKKMLIIRNSWGTEWGDKGYFYLPYEYIETPNLAADFWTINLVE